MTSRNFAQSLCSQGFAKSYTYSKQTSTRWISFFSCGYENWDLWCVVDMSYLDQSGIGSLVLIDTFNTDISIYFWMLTLDLVESRDRIRIDYLSSNSTTEVIVLTGPQPAVSAAWLCTRLKIKSFSASTCIYLCIAFKRRFHLIWTYNSVAVISKRENTLFLFILFLCGFCD